VRTAGLIFLLTVLLLGSVVAYRALSPPLSDDADPPAPSGVSVTASASDRRALREKLSELNGVLQQLPEARAMAQRDRGGPATMRYEELLSRTPDLSRQALDALKESEAKEAALRNEAASLLAAERSSRVATDAPSPVAPGWLIALLAVSSLGLFCFWLQFFWLRSQLRSQGASKEDALFGMRRTVKELIYQHETLKKPLGKFEQALSGVSEQVARVQYELVELKRNVLLAEVGRPEPQIGVPVARDYLGASRAAGKGDSPSRPPLDLKEESKPHVFPVPVGEYMTLVKGSAHHMKPDYMNDVLVEDPKNQGMLLLVKDPPAVKDGTSYIVPSMNYFRSVQDYVNDYAKYFDCADLAVGHIWIAKPAVVSRAAEGWRLVERGVLEVKQ
jgi:hypothetical protein